MWIDGLKPEFILFLVILLATAYFINLANLSMPENFGQRVAGHSLSLFSSILLGYLYLKSHHLLEGLLFSGISTAHITTFVILTRKKEIKLELLSYIIFFSYALVGAGLLLFSTSTANALSVQSLIPFLFLGSSAVGAAVLTINKSQTNSATTLLIIIPWSIWLLSDPNQPERIISAILFLLIIPLLHQKPQIVISPKNYSLNLRIFITSSLLQIALIGTLYYITTIEQVPGYDLTPDSTALLLSKQDVIYFFSVVMTAFVAVGMVLLNFKISRAVEGNNSLSVNVTKGNSINNETAQNQKNILDIILYPLSQVSKNLRKRLGIYEERIDNLEAQITLDKKRIFQLTLLAELDQQLETHLDQPTAAQLTVNTLYQALDCDLISLHLLESERREYIMLASTGHPSKSIPPGYRQSITKGVFSRANRLRKTQFIPDTRLDTDYVGIKNLEFRTEVVIPMIYHGHVKGMLALDYERLTTPQNIDVSFAETVVTKLLKAWEQSNYQQRLTELIHASISLSMLFDIQTALREIASTARQTLSAKFAFVALLDQDGNLSRVAHSGYAPKLMQSLNRDPTRDTLMQAALYASKAFRIRDIRRYKQASHIEIDYIGLRSFLATPIRLRKLSVGAILVFGKQGELFFTENDESLASLLTSQASAAIENSWLYEQLNKTLKITQVLYQLSFLVIQSEKLSEAAQHIAKTAHEMSNAITTGIVLFTPDFQGIEAEVEIDASGPHPGSRHPMDFIKQAVKTGQSIFLSSDQVTSKICFPLQTPLRKYGVLWLDIYDEYKHDSRFGANLQTLANQAAIALERTLLLVESRQQAENLESAYGTLETTYDKTLASLMSALDARDRETEGHSIRVGHVSQRLGNALALDQTQIKALERGALLHDIGKIGISDTILHKPGPLSPDEWKIMRLHPDIGAKIVEGIPFLKDTIPIIRFHQERWDGSGYPLGLKGKDIPLLARIFAVADAFDALTSVRPYRQKVPTSEALQYLTEQAGILFDPDIVNTFKALIDQGELVSVVDD